MNRRGFLSALAGAFVADPERLLWAPGAKTISIPACSYGLKYELIRGLGWYQVELAREDLAFLQGDRWPRWQSSPQPKIGDTLHVHVRRISDPFDLTLEPLVVKPQRR